MDMYSLLGPSCPVTFNHSWASVSYDDDDGIPSEDCERDGPTGWWKPRRCPRTRIRWCASDTRIGIEGLAGCVNARVWLSRLKGAERDCWRWWLWGLRWSSGDA